MIASHTDAEPEWPVRIVNHTSTTLASTTSPPKASSHHGRVRFPGTPRANSQ